ncbi:db46d445-5140-46bf-a428-92aab25c8e11 [Thermothielavioides terrestris]|uniref:Db46d445-5140-46bf-a428-92aab25c8e11 n=1 Tax=Thermothielavioides terrestris TaxID=2587410 RepID=A0A3S5CWX8_9PEZI|nr:db46d445-5140-46bf-a428-92aab25c8e11 [Thermothielavioides terrestris]
MPAGKPALVAPASGAELRALKRRIDIEALDNKNNDGVDNDDKGDRNGKAGADRNGDDATASSSLYAAASEEDVSASCAGGAGAATRLAPGEGAQKGRRDHHRDRDAGGDPSFSSTSSFDDDDDGEDNKGKHTPDEDDEEILREIERRILDVFSDAYCNKHLVYSMLELVLVRLLPELTEKGVLQLWEERIPGVSEA